MSLIITKDRNCFYFINKKIKCHALDKVMPLITHLGSLVAAVIISCLLMILDRMKIVEAGIFVPITVIISQTIIQVIKLIVNRPRPMIALQDVNVFNQVLEYYSFPSGHTAAAFAIAVSISALFNIVFVTLILFIIAMLVGISRMYIGVHYPTDVVIGALLSIIVVLLLHPYIGYMTNLL